MVRIAFEKKTIKKLGSIRFHLKMNATSVPELVDELCDTVSELNNIITHIKKTSKNNTLLELFKQLLYLEKKSTKKERVMFFILREVSNGHTVFLKSVMNRFSWLKTCSTQNAQNLISELEKNGLITIVKECPNCKTIFRRLHHQCENCGKKLILQDIYFKDKRSRPRYAIEITDKGRVFVREWVHSYLSLDTFFNTWKRSKSKLSLFDPTLFSP
ncbi:hypothetical protein LCGC14_3033150 [marine sediment metagenome]|uniref:Uncharacterized protein n=1 Tax=marine sediment metagenome TaxID=412755 RepID=A0A0F8WRK9_9ZZZZ